MRTPLLLLALALPLAACDSDSSSGPGGGSSSGLVTAQITGGPAFDATTATATLGQDWSLTATDASGRMIKILTEKSQTGTFPITQFNALGYLFGPKVSWVGSRVKRSGSLRYAATMNSYGVRPRSVLSRFAKL